VEKRCVRVPQWIWRSIAAVCMVVCSCPPGEAIKITPSHECDDGGGGLIDSMQCPVGCMVIAPQKNVLSSICLADQVRRRRGGREQKSEGEGRRGSRHALSSLLSSSTFKVVFISPPPLVLFPSASYIILIDTPGMMCIASFSDFRSHW